MQIDTLTLDGFRNYRHETFAFDARCNLICGENAQGKTNLLESIVYLCCGQSPRTRSEKELIGFSEQSARITAHSLRREREFETEIVLTRGMRRRLRINGVAVKKTADLSAVLNCVYFCPEDLLLIRAGASVRRRFMDTALTQLRPRYGEALAEYQRLQEHKTKILREAEEHPRFLAVLPEFEEAMVRYGALLIYYRARFCRRLAEIAADMHADCSGGREHLEIRYCTVSGIGDPFAPVDTLREELWAHLQAHRSAERAVRQCLSGPHKDDLEVLLNGNSAKQFGSQGQTRTAALALKLAERELYQNAIGEYPLLLLDDVLSELDPRRQEFVLNRIQGGQVFISCCEEETPERLLGGKLLSIAEGRLQA